MANSEEFDDIIFGGGKGGKSLAMALGPAGRKVALIEQGMIGGTCINVACIPTKTMVASTRMLVESRHAGADGFNIQVKEPNLAATLKRKHAVVDGMVKTHWNLFTHTANLEFFYGRGRFVAEKTIEVTLNDGGTKILTGKRIYINTGSRPSIPSIPGLEQSGYLTSTTVMELEVLPTHLAILGGGYIALEFAQIFRRLGCEVTLIERSNRFLPREDEDIAAQLREILEEEGIKILFNSGIDSVTKDGDDTVLKIKDSSGSRDFSCSHLLVATGRLPNTEDLNLEAAGVKTDARNFIVVNEKLETSAPDIWAIGDCKGGPFFTHLSWDDFRILRDNQLYDAKRTTNGRLCPYTLFTTPELGRVGLTEAEARAQGLEIVVAKLPARLVPRAQTVGQTLGLLKAIVEPKTKQILGASILANEGGEIVSAIQVAMVAKMPYTDLGNVMFTHPTMCESLNLLFAGLPR
ncbi:MAG TPA: mercuric reductase [Oculatellaceae cyanobacterium]